MIAAQKGAHFKTADTCNFGERERERERKEIAF